MRGHKAAIVGCRRETLSYEEVSLFARHKPLGFILFARNIKNPEQTKKLVEELRKVVGSPDAPILIDQEGGSVTRLPTSYWTKPPANAPFGELYLEDPEAALKAVYKKHIRIAKDLAELGISVNCAPVIDLQVKGASQVIGDRAFSHSPQIVAALGEAAIKGLRDGRIIPVIKHIPGHGAAKRDSHKVLPYIRLSRGELEDHFYPFQKNAEGPWAMTAHVVYENFDKKYPATLSPTVIQNIIRQAVGFSGFLITDALEMKALKGLWEERVVKSLKAGCDAVLHCSGIYEEMENILNVTPVLEEASVKRLERSFQWLKSPDQDNNSR